MCTSAAPNTPPTRTKRLRLNDDGDSADSVTTEAQDALLREDLVRLGSLPHTRKGMDRICEVQSGLLIMYGRVSLFSDIASIQK